MDRRGGKGGVEGGISPGVVWGVEASVFLGESEGLADVRADACVCASMYMCVPAVNPSEKDFLRRTKLISVQTSVDGSRFLKAKGTAVTEHTSNCTNLASTACSCIPGTRDSGR